MQSTSSPSGPRDPNTGMPWAPRFGPLIVVGHAFLCNLDLPFADEGVDFVCSNNVPIDGSTWLGPGIQSSEIRRVLRSGGEWRHDGIIVFTKP